MNGHTPTPWRYAANSFGTRFIYGNPEQPRKSPMGVTYNDLVCGGDHPGALTEANAAFIVKAVNSYEAMDKLLAEAADLLNASPKMDAMDLGWKITQFRLARQMS